MIPGNFDPAVVAAVVATLIATLAFFVSLGTTRSGASAESEPLAYEPECNHPSWTTRSTEYTRRGNWAFLRECTECGHMATHVRETDVESRDAPSDGSSSEPEEE